MAMGLAAPPPPDAVERPEPGYLLDLAYAIQAGRVEGVEAGGSIDDALQRAFDHSYNQRAERMRERLAQFAESAKKTYQDDADDKFEQAKGALTESSKRRLLAIETGTSPGTPGSELAACCDCPSVHLRGTGFETIYGGWICAYCMASDATAGGSEEFEKIRGALPTIHPSAAAPPLVPRLAQGPPPVDNGAEAVVSGNCQVCWQWSDELTGDEPTCPACWKLSVSELRALLRQQTRDELAVADATPIPHELEQAEPPPLIDGRKRVTLEISGFNPDEFTDVLDEDDEYDAISDGSSDDSVSSDESDCEHLAPHQREELPPAEIGLADGTRVVWNGWAAAVTSGTEQTSSSELVRIEVHQACPVEVTEMLAPQGGNPRFVNCMRSELTFDPLPAASMRRHSLSVILQHPGQTVGLKVASVGVKNWVFVTKVKPRSPAADAGIVAGDFLVEVGGKTINRLCWEAEHASERNSGTIADRPMEHQSGQSARRLQDVVHVVSSAIARLCSQRQRDSGAEVVVARHATLTILNPDASRASFVDLTNAPSLGFVIDDTSCRIAAVTVGGLADLQGMRVGASVIEVAGTPVGGHRADLLLFLSMLIGQRESPGNEFLNDEGVRELATLESSVCTHLVPAHADVNRPMLTSPVPATIVLRRDATALSSAGCWCERCLEMQGPSFVHAQFTPRQPSTGFIVDGQLDPALPNSNGAAGAGGNFLKVLSPPGMGGRPDTLSENAAPKSRRMSWRKHRKDRPRINCPTSTAPHEAPAGSTQSWAPSQGISSGDVLCSVNGQPVPFFKVVIPVDTMAPGQGSTPLGITFASGGFNSQVFVSSVQPKGLAAKHGIRPGWALLSIVETWPFGGDEPDVYTHGQRAVSRNLDMCVARLHDACSGRCRIELRPGSEVSRLRLKQDSLQPRSKPQLLHEWYGESHLWRISVAKTVIIGNQEVEKTWILLAVNGIPIGKLAHDWSKVVTDTFTEAKNKAQIKRLSQDIGGWDGDRNVDVELSQSMHRHLRTWTENKDRSVAFLDYINGISKPAVLLFQRTAPGKKRGELAGQRLLLELHFRRETGTGLVVRALRSFSDTPVGIGIQRRGKIPRVIHVAPGSPADKAEVKVGWDILRINGVDVSSNPELCDAMLLGCDFLEIMFRGPPSRVSEMVGPNEPDADLRSLPGALGVRHLKSELGMVGTREAVVWADSTKWKDPEPMFGDDSDSDESSDPASDADDVESDDDDSFEFVRTDVVLKEGETGTMGWVLEPHAASEVKVVSVADYKLAHKHNIQPGWILIGMDGQKVSGNNKSVKELSKMKKVKRREVRLAFKVQQKKRVEAEKPTATTAVAGGAAITAAALSSVTSTNAATSSPPNRDLKKRNAAATTIQAAFRGHKERKRLGLLPTLGADDDAMFEYFTGTCSDCAKHCDDLTADGEGGPARCDACWEAFDAEETEGPLTEEIRLLGGSGHVPLGTSALGPHGPSSVEVYYEGDAELGMELTTFGPGQHYVTAVKFKRGANAKSQTVFEGQRLLQINEGDQTMTDETAMRARLQAARASGTFSLVLRDDPDGYARAKDAREKPVEQQVVDYVTPAEIHNPPADGRNRNQQDEVVYATPDGTVPPPRVLQPPSNVPWWHGPGQGKTRDMQKLQSEDGGYPTGRFFVCEIDPQSSSYPGYVLYVGAGGKPTRHKVKDEDGSGTLLINNKRYGNHRTIEDLIRDLSNDPLPAGWPVLLEETVDRQTGAVVKMGVAPLPRPQVEWFHGTTLGKDGDAAKLRNPDDTFSEGRFFVTDLALDHHRAPAYVLAAVGRGRPTRHLIKQDESGFLTVNKKSYGNFSRIEDLVSRFCAEPLPDGWPVLLRETVDQKTRSVIPIQSAESTRIDTPIGFHTKEHQVEDGREAAELALLEERSAALVEQEQRRAAEEEAQRKTEATIAEEKRAEQIRVADETAERARMEAEAERARQAAEAARARLAAEEEAEQARLADEARQVAEELAVMARQEAEDAEERARQEAEERARETEETEEKVRQEAKEAEERARQEVEEVATKARDAAAAMPFWYHPMCLGGKRDSAKLRDPHSQELQSDGTFFVCPIPDNHKHAPGWFLHVAFAKAKGTLHLIQEGDSGDLIVDKKFDYGHDNLESLITALTNPDIGPDGNGNEWPVPLTAGLDRDTNERVALSLGGRGLSRDNSMIF